LKQKTHAFTVEKSDILRDVGEGIHLDRKIKMDLISQRI